MPWFILELTTCTDVASRSAAYAKGRSHRHSHFCRLATARPAAFYPRSNERPSAVARRSREADAGVRGSFCILCLDWLVLTTNAEVGQGAEQGGRLGARRLLADLVPAFLDVRSFAEITYSSHSKLAINLFTRVLAREHPDLLINCCCPGACDTVCRFFFRYKQSTDVQ